MSLFSDVQFKGVLDLLSGGFNSSLVSGTLAAMSSGYIGVVYSGTQAVFSGVIGNVVSGTTSRFSGSISNVRSGTSLNLGGLGSGFTGFTVVSGEAQFANKAVGISVSGVNVVFCSSQFPMADTTYMAYVTMNFSGFDVFVSGKTVSGFSVGLIALVPTASPPGGSTIDWVIFR